MKIFLWGNALLILSFLIHLVIWKIRVPQRQTKTLFTLFGMLLFLEIPLIDIVSDHFPALAEYRLDNLMEYAHVSLYYLCLSLMYIVFYGALEVDSPSLVMVLRVAKEGVQGLPISEFYESMNDDLLVKPRVENLVRDKQAIFENGKYKISEKGRSFISIFIFYRKLLNAGKGG